MVDINEIITDELLAGTFNILDQKPKNSYTKSINNAIKLVSINPKKSIPFGSFTYRAQKFPGDLDMMELIIGHGKIDEIVNRMHKGLIKIVKNLNEKKGYYLGDVKIGLDPVFIFDIGIWVNGLLYDYYPDEIKNHITSLFNSGYLTKEDFNNLIKLVKNKPTHDEYDLFFEELRKHFILRWTKQELLKGFKILLPNRKMTLNEALRHKTMVKIDAWIPIDNKYVEVSNFYILIQYDKEGNYFLINLPQDYLTGFEQNLLGEIEKLYASKVYFKPFKLVKRLWSVARIRKDNVMLNILNPLISSDASSMSQINSQIEVILLILEHVRKPPFKILIDQIDNFKPRLANIIDIDFDEDMIDKLIDNIVFNYNKMPRSKLIEKLTYMKKYLLERVNEYTYNYLNNKGLIPPPRQYLPKILKYRI